MAKWQDPPPSDGGRAKGKDNDRLFRELQAHPGKWALVTTARSQSSAAPWQRRGCETVARKSTADGTRFDIYARWPEGAG